MELKPDQSLPLEYSRLEISCRLLCIADLEGRLQGNVTKVTMGKDPWLEESPAAPWRRVVE